MFATTLNIHLKTLAALSLAAESLGITRRNLIVHLLMRMMHDIERYQRGFSTISYQPDDPGRGWHCFAIRFKPEENEYFQDLRKICKCSLSLLVAMAADAYLIEMQHDKQKGVYNYYHFTDYSIHRESSATIICWRIYWGKKKKTKPLLE